MTISSAARLLGIRPDSLLIAAQAGRINFTWGADLRGQKTRLFDPQDIEMYRERVREKLRARLAKLDGDAA